MGTYKNKLRSTPSISIELLQELLNKNQITPSSKHYEKVHKYFNKYNFSIHKTTGLQLIQAGDSFKLQIPPREKVSITKSDTTTTYQMYLLIAAY